jgi:hypothetical protein
MWKAAIILCIYLEPLGKAKRDGLQTEILYRSGVLIVNCAGAGILWVPKVRYLIHKSLR